MASLGLVGVLLALVHKAYLSGFVTVFLDGLELSHYARTCLNHGARYVFAVGTKDGSHSDLFS
jgi:hypothetical protein